MMDEGRFSLSADVTHQRIGAWQRDRTDDRPVSVYCVHGLNLPKRLAILRFKNRTLQTLRACSAAGLCVHLGGAIG
jgi:hypothetical protein